ncbi:hypothetical protein DKT75_16210 [Leucothrix arctica]|uniref:Uncharacterized protein n=1 Tax=Leucothrix arctica TaxID=1481894 RepID=A0A317CDV0_9GAMM|nr:hypothetical protein DKT75_16210 [Leucothrix arctica]
MKQDNKAIPTPAAHSFDRDRRLTQIRLPSGDLISNTYSGGLLTRTATYSGQVKLAIMSLCSIG